MSRVHFILIGFFLLVLSDTKGTTYYTRSTGNITGNIWGTTTTGTGGALPALVNGDIIVIDDNITITTNFMDWNSVTITINLYANINFNGGKLDLAVNSIIDFKTSSASITSVGGGSSDKIRFGNGSVWNGSDPDVFGPGIMNKDYVPGGPLPIELLFFKAIQSGDKVTVSWATASELNFDYFSVERSANGLDFGELEQVKGHGTTNERNDYRLEDRDPLIGKNYYRLKSVDFDGYTEYFKVVVVDFSGEKTFSIAPNPTDGTSLTFWTNFVPDATSSITIFDNYSSIIGKYKSADFGQPIGFDTPLKSGVYYARIVSKDFVKVEKFIVR